MNRMIKEEILYLGLYMISDEIDKMKKHKKIYLWSKKDLDSNVVS